MSYELSYIDFPASELLGNYRDTDFHTRLPREAQAGMMAGVG
jgi:hypothetical protein